MGVLEDKANFARTVLAVVRRVGVGRVATYGDVAAAAGRPRAWRAVGNVMRQCRNPDIPCHRVIAAEGRLGGYGGNVQLKAALLRSEGIIVAGNRVKNWRERRWRPTGDGRPHPPQTRRARLKVR